MGGRAAYTAISGAERVLLLSFEPRASPPATMSIHEGPRESGGCERSASPAESVDEALSERHRAVLLARAQRRSSAHPTFPPSSEPSKQAAAIDATIAAMEWPTTTSVRGAEAAAHRVEPLLLWCDPWREPSDAHAEPMLVEMCAAIFWPALSAIERQR